MPKREFIGLLMTLGLAARFVDGQLEPDCNPLHAECPAKKAWPTENYYIDFTKETGPPENWIIANYEVVNFGPKGAEFTYGKRGDAPNMWTDFYILGGRYDVEMQIAPGQGVISSSVLWSDAQDEIDWEFSGNQHGEKPFPPPDGKWTVETNIFAQGKMWDGAATYQKDVVNPTTQFHTYSVEWDENHMNWYVNNQVVRSVQASNTPSGFIFPQTPMKLQLGVWGGGDPANNYWTIQWAGGEIDMKGVPYTMYVRSVNITNKYPACQYKYNDKSGKITGIDRIQDGCGSSSATVSATSQKIVNKNPPTPTPTESIKAVSSMASYPVGAGSAVSSSSAGSLSSGSPLDNTATSQAGPASSRASSVPTSLGGAGGYPVRSSAVSVPTTPLSIVSSYPVSPLSSSTKHTPLAGSGSYPVASSALSSKPSTPLASISGYPVASTSSTGGFLSSLSSLVQGTSSGASSSNTMSMPSSKGTYPATHITTSASPLTSSSVALSNSSDSTSSSTGTTTSVTNHSVTGSSTMDNNSSNIGGITASTTSTTASSYPVRSGVLNMTSVLTSPMKTGSPSSSSFPSSLSSTSGSLVSSTTSSEVMPSTYTFSSEITTSFLSTVYSTNIVTITSCAATVKNCPVGQVTTETVSLYTTVCPVTNTVIDGTTFSGQVDSTPPAVSSIPISSYPVSSQLSTSPLSSETPVTSLVPSAGTSSPAFVSSGIYQNTTSTATRGISTTIQSPSGSTSQNSSTPTQLTTSTVYSTNIYTITSCAPTVTNCPAQLGQVTTELVSLYTTVCPVTQEGSTGVQETSALPVSTSVPSVPAQSSTAPLISSSSISSPPVLTTSTVYTSSVYTVSSCAPGATECASSLGLVTTELVPLYTTVCPVKDTPTVSSSPTSPTTSQTSHGQASSVISGASSILATTPTHTPETPVYTTSTVYSTNIYTVTSCAPGVTNCPAKIGSVTTEIIPVSTTVCPVSDKTIPAAVTSTEITISKTFSNSVVVITSIITYIDTPAPSSPTGVTSTANTAGTGTVPSLSGTHTTNKAQPCTTLTLGSYFTTVITYASLTQHPPASVSHGSILTSYYTVSPTQGVDVPSYTMTETASTVEMSAPSSTIVTTSVAATQGQKGEDGQCICQPTISTVYATVTMTVAKTTITSTVEPPFPSTYGTGTGTDALKPGTVTDMATNDDARNHEGVDESMVISG
ncbi:hypothetical protein CHU98_g5776 [Xylaria longipes]|nr:hypothetical protein CHU98_g5776 [Xylaria longipes]